MTSRKIHRPIAMAVLFSTSALAQQVAPAARGTLRLDSPEERSVFVEETDYEFEEEAPEAVTVQPGDVHVVQEGETLWSLAERYLGDTDAWPRLWSYNPHVTNPHYIYPGETIRLSPEAVIAEAAVEPIEEEPAQLLKLEDDGPTLRVRSRLPSDVMFLRQHAFLEESELKESGRITAAKDEKLLLSTLDDVYIQFSEDSKAKADTRLAAYRILREVVHPKTDERLGYLVEVLGTVQVNEVDEGRLAHATIVEAENSIERDVTRVGPLRKRFHQIRPRKNEASAEGTVVDSLRQADLIGTDAIVLVDRGESHGVKTGNRFVLVSRGDGMTAREEDDEDRKIYPTETTGEILVLEARKNASVGFVTRLSRETQVGAAVQMRKGY